MIDQINSCFLTVSGLLLWCNVYKLYKDKQVAGVSLLPVAMFILWGFWNIYYFLHLNQIFSLVANLSPLAAYFVWLVLALRFKSRSSS